MIMIDVNDFGANRPARYGWVVVFCDQFIIRETQHNIFLKKSLV